MAEDNEWEEIRYTCSGFKAPADKVGIIEVGSPLHDSLSKLTEQELKELFSDKE